MTDRPALRVYEVPAEDAPALPPVPERQRVRAIIDLVRVGMIRPDEAVDRILAVFQPDEKKPIRDR